MMKKSKTWLWIGIAAVLIGAVVLVLCLRNNDKSEDIGSSQTVVEEETSYDLEETVRILNGIWMGQEQLASFEEYQDYIERQNYSEVPKDVRDAKEAMMPILQKMSQLQKEYDEMDIWSSLMPNLGGNLVSRMDPSDYGLLLCRPGLGTLNVVKKAADAAFDEYELGLESKKELLQRIQEARDLYYDFLNTFVPVYTKYMDEWNLLCLDKDKAYIALYSKRPDQVVEYCDKVLDNYPDNRETLLLKAMGLVQLSRWNQGEEPFQFSMGNIEVAMLHRDTLLDEAQEIIEYYEAKYPKQTAPALLLEGLIQEYKGNHSNALTLFHQSAEEYPQQATQLTDMLNSYRARTYLNNSIEGVQLLNLYKSIMLGSGFFSPNFMKAMYYDQKGDLENCSREIYNHFFRRGNQDAYDGMLMDMYFCEEFFPASFNRLLPERNYVNLYLQVHSEAGGLKDLWMSQLDDTSIDLTVDNQSDIVLTNLRIFLCVHFTRMKDEDFHIIKIPEIGRLEVHNKVAMNNIELGIPGKTVGDISEVRAIAIIEINGVSKICWFDNIYNTSDDDNVVDYNKSHENSFQKQSKKLDGVADRSRDTYLESIKMNDDNMLRSFIMENTKIIKETNWFGFNTKYIEVVLPRELILLYPTFRWNKNLKPVEEKLDDCIILKFDTKLSPNNDDILYMTSIYNYINYAIHIVEEDGGIKVKSVENLAIN